VPDISWIDWAALARAGFKAVVFDKDNTLCEPFALEVPPHLQPSFAACHVAFGPANLVLYSNSAGLTQYDPAGEEAAALEAAFGVHVLRHADKKPAGGCAELTQRCGWVAVVGVLCVDVDGGAGCRLADRMSTTLPTHAGASRTRWCLWETATSQTWSSATATAC
jgi:phosphatidylglycerophosphatase GEP4